MKIVTLKNHLNTISINNYLLILLSVFISISVYITDVIILLLCFSWILEGQFKRKFLTIIQTPILWSTILFLIYFFISYNWSESTMWNMTTQKQVLILLLPVLYTLKFENSYLKIAKYGFITGLSINVLLSLFTIIYPKNSFFKRGHYEDNLFAHGFLDHFDYSIFLCFGILVLLSLYKMKRPMLHLVWILVLITALLNSYGRIGIIAFCVFFPISILMQSNSRFNYIFLFSTLFFIVISFYTFSPFKNRIIQTVHNIEKIYNPLSLEDKIELDAIYLSNQDSLTKEFYIEKIKKDAEWVKYIENKKPQHNTSIGQRYIYTKNSFLIAKKNPVFGFGANQFQHIYQSMFNYKNIKHPHNNFIFIMIELGLVGLFLVLLIFWFHIKQFFQSNKKSFLQFVFPLFFMLIMCADNYFLNHNTLTLFCLFSFLIFKNTNYISS